MDIAVAIRRMDNKVGPIILVVVGVDSKFLRVYPTTKRILVDKELRKKYMDKVHQKLENLVVIKIATEDLLKISKEKAVPGAILGGLNSIKEFWEHKIIIDYNKEEFMENYVLPSNLKRIERKLKISKWNFGKTVSKAMAVADIAVERFLDMEMDNIELAWGKIGDEDEFIKKNPNCPHIRGNDNRVIDIS